MHSYVKEEKLTFIVMVGKADNQLSKNVENSASEKQPKQEQKWSVLGPPSHQLS